MTLDNNAIEAGLRHFVKTNKKVDFIGKQALQEMTTREGALPRRLVFMEVDTDNVDPEGNETMAQWQGKLQAHPMDFKCFESISGQVCIRVECVLPYCWPYPVVSGGVSAWGLSAWRGCLPEGMSA